MRTPILCATLAALLVVGCNDDDGTGPDSTTGTIAGTVTSDGSGVVDAQISLTGGGTQATNASGQYTFTNVPAGDRTVTLTVPDGLQLISGEEAAKTVNVVAGQTATVDWSLTAGGGSAQVDTVRLSGVSFTPSELTVPVGRTVVWINTQSVFHTITPDGHTQWERVETSAQEEVLRVTFNEAGTFDYFCEPHRSQGMTGRIIVEEQ